MKKLSLNNCRLDGRYDIRRELGRGSYAEIFVAHDTLAAPESPHSLVVIKALNVFLQNDLDVDLERTLVENFQNEAIALDRVRHPNIISRLGHGTARDLQNTVFHYLALEYMPGGDLARACREKSLKLSQALFYLEQVCAGLGHAHEKGIIHRDIKPQNLLLSEDRKTVKIADFGVARMSQADTPITRVGTNMFAPPEHSPMFSGNTGTLAFKELTPAADVYSLAKSAYVLITCESPRFFANQPVTELPFDFRQKPWAKDLLRVLGKATQNDSRERYQTVNDFWKDLSTIKSLADDENDGDLTHISERAHAIPQAHIAKGYTPLAPQLPRFNTTSELKTNAKLSALANAPLVVKPNEQYHVSPSPQPQIAEQEPVFQDEIIYQSEPPLSRRNNLLRRVAAFVLIIGIFAGLLYATNVYFRRKNSSATAAAPSQSKPVAGRANTDVNLRQNAGTDSDPRGIVPKNSRVKIVNLKDNWYEIDVVEFSRPKENPTDAEHGWVNKKYIDVDN